MERRPSDAVLLALLATTLVAWAAAPFLLHGWHTPVGPDAPVYLWWARIAGVEGLSAVGERVGEPALALALAGTLRLSPIAALTALEIAGTVAIGLAAAALVRAMDPEDRAAWFLSGLLAGTFASHLAAGYVANLLFAGMFVAAGITHPLFLALGVAIIVAAAALAYRAERTRAVREIGAAIGGLAVLGLSALSLVIGPDALRADTSRDALLRRAGLDGILREAYLERFLRRWTRYAPWGVLPLAVAGFRRAVGFPRRFLAAWGLAVVVGVVVALATRVVPPDRFLTFAFVAPILAGPGALRIARTTRLPRRVATVVAGVLVTSMLAGAGAAWVRQEPFLSVRELTRLEAANAAAVAAPDAALLFPVASEESAFLVTRAGNLLRATVPPDRIRDIALEVQGTSPGAEAAALRAAATEDAATVIAARAGLAQRILVVPFAPRVPRGAPWTPVATGVYADPPLAVGATADPLLPSSPIAMVLAGIAALTLVGLIGRTAARAIGLDRIDALLVAPAFGIAAMVLAAVAVDRLGFRLVGWVAPLAASALAAAIGLGARFLAEIDAGAEPRA